MVVLERPHCGEERFSSGDKLRGRSIFLEHGFVSRTGILRDQANDHLLAWGRAQRLEAARALAVELEEEGVDLERENPAISATS